MSKAWDTHVSIDRVEITPLSNFKFYNVFIQDHVQDTLIFAEYAEAKNYNVFSLFKKTIDIGNITVKDVVFKVQRQPEAEFFNIHFLLAFFEGDPNRKGPRPKKFEFHIGGADLVRARVHLSDPAIGTDAIVTCDTAYVHGHGTMGVDMIGKRVWGDKAHLAGTNFNIHVYDIVPNAYDSIYQAKMKGMPVDSTIPYWDVGCEKLLLNDVGFQLRNDRIGLDSTRVLDFSNLNFTNINLDVDSFRLDKEVFTGQVKQIHGIDHGGFELKSLHGHALISPKELAVTNFKMETNTSSIGHAIIFKYKTYRDFFEFPDKVKMFGTFDSTTHITFRDLAAFAPVMEDNVFIAANLDHPIEIKGKFKGTVNNFRARNLDIKIADHTHILGNLSMNDVTIPDAAFMDLNLKKVATDYQDLKKIIPFVDIPPNLATLGRMKFKGSYTGFFQDFVAYGQIDTDLGRVNSDVQLNLRKGKKAAAYKGGLAFSNFDIGTFLGNKDVGRITVHSKVRGKGLILDALDAELQNAIIDSFSFKKYVYKDIHIDGFFKQKKFDGDIISRDTNMNVFIHGIMDLNGELPKVNILGYVKNIDFKSVNISEESIGLHLDTFNINAQGNNLDNFTGNLSVRGINGHRGDIYSELDLIRVKAENIPNPDTSKNHTRRIHLKSDIVEASVFGSYNVVTLVRSIENFIEVNHPNLYKALNPNKQKEEEEKELAEIEDNRTLLEKVRDAQKITLDTIPHQDFNFVVNIQKNTKNLTQLIDKNFKSLEKIILTGHYDGTDEYLTLEGTVGEVLFGDIGFKDITLNGKAIEEKFGLLGDVGELEIKDKPFIPNIHVDLNAIGDSVLFLAQGDAVGEFASDLSIRGKLEIKEKLVILKLDSSQLRILDQEWAINDDNYVKVGDKVLDIKNVVLSSGQKRIALSSVNENLGAKVKVDNMDLGWLYGLMKPLPKIEIDGIFSGEATMQDIFKQEGIAADILLDTLIINNDYWGSNSRLIAESNSLKSIFKGTFTHSSDFVDSLNVNATFTPKSAIKKKVLQTSISSNRPNHRENLLDINANVTNAKASILEYFLKEQISETEGLVNAQARVFGNLKGKETVMNIEGDGLVSGVKTKVNFLQTKYALADGKVKMNNTGFWVDPPLEFKNENEYYKGGIEIVEVSEPDKIAYIGGGLTHNHLKDFGLDFTAVINNNLVMKTTIEDNSTFYGTVYASGTASFLGPFEKLKLSVNATTEPNTVFNLPLGGPLEVSETNYINFVNKKDTATKSDTKSIKDQILAGLDIEITANVRPSAVARLIIDEKAGDIIEGKGRSDDMRISYSPTGELKMFGTYEIEEGNYLFTYKNLINKPFDVEPGGTITWGDNDGDPYKAQLDIQAKYVKSLSLSNLVQSYTAENPDLATMARQPSEVELFMNLRGELFSPEINFNLEISDAPSQLQNYINLALRAIRSDKNELNRQVFGIIALQQFLPLENAQNVNVGSSAINTGISTVSELVSQQLSLYINDLLEGVIKDVGVISSLEFDFNFNIRDNNDLSATNSTTSNIRLGSDVRFWNDRIRVYAGANMDIAGDNEVLTNVDANANYVGGDFKVEYYITRDGQLKIKAYNRTESTILGRSVRTGIGLSYKKEFNTFQDLIDEARRNRKKSKGDLYNKQIKKYKNKITVLEGKIAAATDEKKKNKFIAQKNKFAGKLKKAENNLEEHKKAEDE